MELYQLRYFERIAHHGSIRKASEELHISQPALSKALSHLEDGLSTELFTRVGNRLQLNNQGDFFLKNVTRILREVDDVAQNLKRLSEGYEGTVKVGVFGPQKEALKCTVDFMHEYPGIDIVFEARQAKVSSSLIDQYDVFFFPEGPVFKDIPGIAYAQCQLKLAVCDKHPLARRRKVSLNEFKDDSFILSNTTAGVLEQSYELCRENGFYPKVRAVTSSGAAQMQMIREGLGVGFIDSLMQENKAPGYSTLELDGEGAPQNLCFTSAPVNKLPSVAKRYLSHVHEFFNIPLDFE